MSARPDCLGDGGAMTTLTAPAPGPFDAARAPEPCRASPCCGEPWAVALPKGELMRVVCVACGERYEANHWACYTPLEVAEYIAAEVPEEEL